MPEPGAAADGLRMRDATIADAAAIAEIYNQSLAAGDASMEEEPKSSEDIAGWIEAFGPRETILVLEAVDSDTIRGWGVIKRYSDRAGYRYACETAVYLRRDQRGGGLGTRIKMALIERCRAWRYHHLVAKIFADNAASIGYNRKLGYELVGVQKEIGWKNGRWQDVAILQLVLAEDASSDPTR